MTMDVTKTLDSVAFNTPAVGSNNQWKLMRVSSNQRAELLKTMPEDGGDTQAHGSGVDNDHISNSGSALVAKLIMVFSQLTIPGQWQIDQLMKKQIRDATRHGENRFR